jgi:hypothetical protein
MPTEMVERLVRVSEGLWKDESDTKGRDYHMCLDRLQGVELIEISISIDLRLWQFNA